MGRFRERFRAGAGKVLGQEDLPRELESRLHGGLHRDEHPDRALKDLDLHRRGADDVAVGLHRKGDGAPDRDASLGLDETRAGVSGPARDDSEKVPRIIEKGLRVQNPDVEMPVVDVDVGSLRERASRRVSRSSGSRPRSHGASGRFRRRPLRGAGARIRTP